VVSGVFHQCSVICVLLLPFVQRAGRMAASKDCCKTCNKAFFLWKTNLSDVVGLVFQGFIFRV
jgi:hypothetical protein